MDSKGIRVTPRKSTARPSKSMVLRQCIERHLAGFESTCSASTNRKPSRGEETELLAIDWLRARGFSIVARRLKTPYAEVDLLIRSPNLQEWFVVEVKSSLWPDGLALGLSYRQRARLWRASYWIQDEISRVVEASSSGARLSLALLVREDGLMHRVGFRILPIF